MQGAYAVIGKVVKEQGIDATLVKVEDIMELLNYNIILPPRWLVDGEVKLKGHVPTENEVKKILGM